MAHSAINSLLARTSPGPGPQPGEPAPWITLPTHDKPIFHVHTAAGRYLLLLFLGDGGHPCATQALAALASLAGWLELGGRAAFTLCTRPLPDARLAALDPRLIHFIDREAIAHRAYGLEAASPPRWLLLDPTLRVMATVDGGDPGPLLPLLAHLPPPALHAGCPTPPPILVVPRVFEPDLCAHLIALYQAHGGEPSGFMREVDGRTRLVHDAAHKLRRDCELTDPALQAAIQQRIRARLVPEIKRSFQFEVTRMERYLVACYDTAHGGHFRPHRDNTTSGTAHRRFAVSLNLNAEAYEGGDLRFAEYGPQTWRAPTGGAVVFSCSILHECTPITRGARYVFLPFLYDEAAARLRARNASRVDLAPLAAPA